MLQRFMIKHRIWLLLGLCLSVVLAISAYAIQRSHQQYIDLKKQSSALQVRSAVAAVDKYYQRYAAGEISEASAKRQARFAIQSLATSKRSYFYIYHYRNFMVMHPFLPNSVRTDDSAEAIEIAAKANLARVTGIMQEKKLDIVDPTPLDLFLELHGDSGEGFIEYLYTAERLEGHLSLSKPGDPRIHPAAEKKLVFGASFEPWQWVILTGIYNDDAQAAFIQWVKSLAIIISLLTAGLLTFTYFISRSITTPLSKVAELMDDISHGSGDLTNRLQDSGRDELSMLGKGFNLFVENLAAMINQMLESNCELKTQSDLLSKLTDSNAKRVHEQFKETELLASATTELSASFSEVANNAKESVNSAKSAEQSTHNAQSAVENNRVSVAELNTSLQDAQKTMEVMQQENNHVNNVLGVIRGIAEQTNLLALNAAIEAARAGEQGRGFAVVADEVRNLAQKTQAATLEIDGIIENLNKSTQEAVSAMENGMQNANVCVEAAKDVNHMLESVIASVENIANRSTNIAAAVDQQSQTTEEIAKTSNVIAETSHQAAEEGESCRQANVQVTACIDQLDNLMSRFKI